MATMDIRLMAKYWAYVSQTVSDVNFEFTNKCN